ncbi:MAG: thiamine phosphate synthase [Campylobacterota bacterium]|nr:thiamine phosphate synthase [Campylobacterota bacterium]
MLKKYLITSNEFYTSSEDTFRKRLYEQLQKHLPEYALYRDKSNPNYKTLAKYFVDVCSKSRDVKAFIHGDYKLANEIGAVGVHLTSLQFEDIKMAKELGLDVIVSTHTKDEVLRAHSLGADYVTYSPIFATPNKGEPKGIENLEKLLNETDIKVFALGGIVNKEEVELVSQTSVYGFASIRYFEN